MAQLKDRWGIVYCPPASIRKRRKRWEAIQKALEAEGVAYDFVHSESADSVTRIVNMFIDNGYTTIVVAGGDTALNDAATCLMLLDTPRRRTLSLGVIPNGRSNDFARYWGLTADDIPAAVKALAAGRLRTIDVGRVDYRDRRGQDHLCHFLNCVNIGLTADIIKLRRQTRRLLWSRELSWIVSSALLIFHRHHYHIRMRVNAEEADHRVMTLCVGSALGYGQTPNAVPYNGRLDVTLVRPPKLTSVFEGLWLLFWGRFLNHRSVIPYRTTKVQVADARHAPLNVDGRPMPTPEGPYTITIQQEQINFIIPE